jgi:hypothetical protein
MLKRMLICSWLVLCLSAGLTFGQYDVHYSVGIRYQLGMWDFPDTEYYYKTADDFYNDVRTVRKMQTGNLYGPTASISYQKYGFSLTYLTGSWNLPTIRSGAVIPIDEYNGFQLYTDFDQTFKRSDLVVTASYQIIPRLSAFVGYKNLTLKVENKFKDVPDANSEDKSTGSGVGGGLSGSLQLAPKFHGYATLGYMHLGGDLDTENLIAEGGLRLYFGTTPIYGSFGYRYESFDSGDTILSGPVLTVAYYH